MSALFYSLSPALLAAGTALMIIGTLAACILTMSQWFIHRRLLATGFLWSVTVLFAFYTWGFAVTIINSQAGIFILNDHHFGWFVLICLILELALLKTTYRFAAAPLLVFLTVLLPPHCELRREMAAFSCRNLCHNLAMRTGVARISVAVTRLESF